MRAIRVFHVKQVNMFHVKHPSADRRPVSKLPEMMLGNAKAG